MKGRREEGKKGRREEGNEKQLFPSSNVGLKGYEFVLKVGL